MRSILYFLATIVIVIVLAFSVIGVELSINSDGVHRIFCHNGKKAYQTNNGLFHVLDENKKEVSCK